MKKILDLNCDLGEHEPPSVTAALMKQIGSANIACGGHAGSISSMRHCLLLAKKYGVQAGAHPGLADQAGFGRTAREISPDEFALLLCSQISCLATMAKAEGVSLRHVKLHGALYQMVENDARLGKTYLDCIARFWPRLAIRSIAGGRIGKMAQKKGLRTSPELFADRAYLSPTSLLPRTEPGAVITDPRTIEQNVRRYLDEGSWPLASGKSFRPRAETLCVHGDTRGSSLLLHRLKKLLA